MKKENHKRGVKTKKDNKKKILEIYGYEIWRDPLNYTVVRNKRNTYFTTFKNALSEIRNELIRNKIAGSENLEDAIERINAIDSEFLSTLSSLLVGVGRE